MGAHDAVANAQAEPGTLTSLLGGVKGIEDAFRVGDTGSIVRNGNFNGITAQPRADGDPPAVPGLLHRVIGVIENIQENLLQLLGIAKGRRQLFIELLDDFYAVTGEIVAAELDGLTQHAVDLHQLALHRALPREAQQILHDVFRSLRFSQNDLQIFARVFGDLWILEKEIGKAKNGRQRVIYLVGHARDETADSRHFFRVR